MPNGGILPSCFVCKWAKNDQTRPNHPRAHNPLIEPVECLQHGFHVWLPASHVCANLGDPYGDTGLSTFAEQEGLETGSMYAWFEYLYRWKESPDLPRYYHECLRLASFAEFSGWTLEQKEKAYRQGRLQWERDLIHQQTVQETYDRLSTWYDWLAGSEMAFNRRGVELLDISAGQTVLEIGYGTGHNLLQLAGLVGASGRVAAIDVSPGMARVAGARLAKSGQGRRVLRGLGDARILPYPDGCFDAVFMAFTLELFNTQDISRVLREAHRVLRAGGRLSVVALSLPDTPGRMVRIYEWFHRTWPNIVDCHPIPVADLLRQNGFSIQKLERKMMWGLPVELVCGAR